MLALYAFTTLLAAAFSIGVQASPLSRRDVIAPKITSPDANTVWTVGSVVTVTWDTSNFPPDSQITNPIGKVILGYDENDSLNLDFNNPLAQDFKLRDGSVQLTVPDVPPRDDYLIVLFGDSASLREHLRLRLRRGLHLARRSSLHPYLSPARRSLAGL